MVLILSENIKTQWSLPMLVSNLQLQSFFFTFVAAIPNVVFMLAIGIHWEFAEPMTALPAVEAPGREESRMTCFSCCKVDVDKPEESVRRTGIRRPYCSGGMRLNSLLATFSVASGRENVTDFSFCYSFNAMQCRFWWVKMFANWNLCKMVRGWLNCWNL